MAQAVAPRLVYAGVGVAGTLLATGNEDWLKSLMRGALRASVESAPAAVDNSAQIAALSASVKTLSSAVEGALRAQSGHGASTLLLVGAPIVGAVYYLRGLGWVTLGQMKEQLEGVRQAVCTTIESVKVQLLERIGILQQQGEEMAVWRQEHTAAVGELSAEVHGVKETVDDLGRRLEGVEHDVSRSARGVELLCEFVASANSPSGGAPPRSLQDRLQTFTGIAFKEGARAPSPVNPPLPSTWEHSFNASSSSSSGGSGLVAAVASGRLAP